MPTILIVEDNDFSRDALGRRLERRGYRVVVATDGLQAGAVALRERPDLVLMDLGLPVVDGWEATRRLKGSPLTQHVPVIVLSAHAMTNDREHALSVGADDFDTKPVRFEGLLQKIEHLLRRAAAG
jgi:CheY-like chemotaxis protein